MTREQGAGSGTLRCREGIAARERTAPRSSLPSLLGGIAAAAWLLVIGLAHYHPGIAVRILAPVTTLVASVVQTMLQWIGVEALRAGAFLYAPGAFAYEISSGCTGILPAAVLAVAIIAAPGTVASKRTGLAIGVPLVLALNLLRLLHLFYLGMHAPQWFAPAHAVLWEGAMVLSTFAVWLAWARLADWGKREGGSGKG